jgi:hypothetical protein
MTLISGIHFPMNREEPVLGVRVSAMMRAEEGLLGLKGGMGYRTRSATLLQLPTSADQ